MPEEKKITKKRTTKKKIAKPKAEKEKKPKKPRAVKKVKAEKVEKIVEEKKAPAPPFEGEYLRAIGRRKRSIAQVRVYRRGDGLITINNRVYTEYFPRFDLQDAVSAPLKAVGQDDKVNISVKVAGGGIRGQAEATRHGISRALLLINPTFRVSLKKLGFLTRDSRRKERKKPGLKRARRAPQWSKR